MINSEILRTIFQEQYMPNLKLIRDINNVFADIGADIKLDEMSMRNNNASILCSSVNGQTVYWVGTRYKTTCSFTLSDIRLEKYRFDHIFDNGEGVLFQDKRVVARSKKYLLLIEFEGLDFERFIKRIDN